MDQVIYPLSHGILQYHNDITEKTMYRNVSSLSEPIPIDYLWGNNTEYNQLCKRIQELFRKNKHIITYKQYPYGFGNLFYSVVAMVALAISGNYKLYYEFPEYNYYFDSCFSINILNGNETIDYEYELPDYKTQLSILSTYGRPNIRKKVIHILPSTNIRIGGSLMEIENILAIEKYLRAWTSLFGDLPGGADIWNIRKYFLRLLLNPEPILKCKYLEERKNLITRKYTIGLQLRIGGTLADNIEEYTGVPMNRIDEVIDQVREVIRKRNWRNRVQIYVSSDSSYAIRLIRNKTRNEFPVVSSQLYMKGHTEKGGERDIMRNVLVDLYYMSMADHAIVTWPSSLGRLMCFIRDTKCDAVLNWWEKSKFLKMK